MLMPGALATVVQRVLHEPRPPLVSVGRLVQGSKLGKPTAILALHDFHDPPDGRFFPTRRRRCQEPPEGLVLV